MEAVLPVAEVLSAVGSILIPIILLYWAPKISADIQRSNQRQSRSKLFAEVSSCLRGLRSNILVYQSQFDGTAYGKEISESLEKSVRSNSLNFSSELSLILLAFTETLSEVGRDQFGDIIRVKRARLAAEDLAQKMEDERQTWLDGGSRKITGPVVHKHCDKILDWIDEFDALLTIEAGMKT